MSFLQDEHLDRHTSSQRNVRSRCRAPNFIGYHRPGMSRRSFKAFTNNDLLSSCLRSFYLEVDNRAHHLFSRDLLPSLRYKSIFRSTTPSAYGCSLMLPSMILMLRSSGSPGTALVSTPSIVLVDVPEYSLTGHHWSFWSSTKRAAAIRCSPWRHCRSCSGRIG